MKDWNLEIGGVSLKNPFFACAGAPTLNVYTLGECIKAGSGMVATKSISFQPFTWGLPRPHNIFLDKFGDPGSVVTTELGFWRPEEGEEYVKEIKPLAEKENCKIAANIAVEEYKDDELAELCKKLEGHGADFIEIACPCPIVIPVEVADKWYRDNLSRVVEIVKGAVKIPAFPKLFVDVLTPENVKRVEDAGADAIAFLPPPHGVNVDIDTGKPLVPTYGLYYHRGWRGIGGYWVWLIQTMTKLPLIYSGSIFTGRDAIEKIMLGASVAGVCTAIMYHGYKRITKIITQMDDFMDEKGHTNLKDILGVAAPYVGDLEEFGRQLSEGMVPKEALKISVDSDKCTGCGKCSVCTFGAVTMEDRDPRIDLDLCERCGVCESICPADAITMRRVK